jgi:hypothetical protein
MCFFKFHLLLYIFSWSQSIVPYDSVWERKILVEVPKLVEEAGNEGNGE